MAFLSQLAQYHPIKAHVLWAGLVMLHKTGDCVKVCVFHSTFVTHNNYVIVNQPLVLGLTLKFGQIRALKK